MLPAREILHVERASREGAMQGPGDGKGVLVGITQLMIILLEDDAGRVLEPSRWTQESPMLPDSAVEFPIVIIACN